MEQEEGKRGCDRWGAMTRRVHGFLYGVKEGYVSIYNYDGWVYPTLCIGGRYSRGEVGLSSSCFWLCQLGGMILGSCVADCILLRANKVETCPYMLVSA